MRVKELTVGKEFKVGLPSYSNITSSCYMTFEVGEGEEIDWDETWEIINRQLSNQADNVDPNWMKSGEYNKFFKVTMKIAKGGKKNG